MTVANKIIYGDNTLIDLTSDTATTSDVLSGKTFHLANGIAAAGTCLYNCDTSSDTATEADVASGKTFHLASGAIGTGTFSASMNEEFMTRKNTTLLINLEKLPDWFVVVPTVDNAGATPMLAFFLYNGTNTYTASAADGIMRINYSVGMRWSMSFSNGTLTLTRGSNASSPYAISSSKYKIYYL